MTQNASEWRVLIVEDDDDTRKNLRDILELDHYEVAEVSSAAAAERYADWSRVFAIILDRRLPDGSADQILPKLRKLAPRAAVIIVTGFPDLEGAVSCLRLGAADYILKPINPEALRASLENIKEKRRLAVERERSEAAFRNLVEAAECMIVILGPARTLCYFSPFAEQLTGYKVAEVLGQDFVSLFVPENDRPGMTRMVEQGLEGVPARGFECRIRCRDGAARTLLWNARKLDDFAGAPALLAVGQDITEYQRAYERVLQTERLAAIGQMVTGLAHESRNALQRSKACLEMLAMEVEDRPEAFDLVQKVHKAQDHLHRLYEEVRAYAAPIRLQREACQLDDLWRETWAGLAAERDQKRVRLLEFPGDANLLIEADSFALGQVFRNILENAIAACDEPGEVHVRCENAWLDQRPAVRVSFRDNGAGLNAEQRQKIFDPFYTTKTRGTGLGMAIAKRIVEAHGGQLAVGAATPGAEIMVTLPRRS